MKENFVTILNFETDEFTTYYFDSHREALEFAETNYDEEKFEIAIGYNGVAIDLIDYYSFR